MTNLLKEARKRNNFTQYQAADFLNVSLRSYKTYELDIKKANTNKYEYMLEKLNKNAFVDEEHGLLTIEIIKTEATKVLENYDVDFCYLFGSYAKNKQTEKSDVDLLISTSTTGIEFYGLVEKLRNALNKKVDLLKVNQLNNNLQLLSNVLKDGIKIYERTQE